MSRHSFADGNNYPLTKKIQKNDESSKKWEVGPLGHPCPGHYLTPASDTSVAQVLGDRSGDIRAETHGCARPGEDPCYEDV
jgi:hypothetical protein